MSRKGANDLNNYIDLFQFIDFYVIYYWFLYIFWIYLYL